MTHVLGTDVSFWQDDNSTYVGVDFNKMRAAGSEYVLIRVGQGSWRDPDFARNYAEAGKAGLYRGCYWFYDSRTPPGFQAELCADTVPEVPELGMWADFEENYAGQYQGWQNFKAFVLALQLRFPRVGVYTAPIYWMTHRPTGEGDLAFFKSFPLWIAHYGVIAPLIPSPWTEWVFWQYTDNGDGLRYGAESREIDLDVFDGDIYKFRNYFDLTELPPTGEIAMALYEGIAKYTSTPNVRIRKPTAAGDLNPDGMTIGAIQPGQAFKGSETAQDPTGKLWMHLTQVGNNPIDGWSAAWLLDYHEVTPPPPPPAEVHPASAVVTMSDGSKWEGNFQKVG